MYITAIISAWKKNMKNLKNIFTVALIATCMSGCTGFLDIEPETTLTGKISTSHLMIYVRHCTQLTLH